MLQDAVHVSDSARCQASFLVVTATASKGLGIGLGDLGRLELVKDDRAEQGLDILINKARITLVSFWRNLRLDVIEPAVEKFFKVVLLGSTYDPSLVTVMSRAHSAWAARLVPLKLCHLSLRLPVAGSVRLKTIAQWPGERSRMWPFIVRSPSDRQK